METGEVRKDPLLSLARDDYFQQFLRERLFLNNVTPKTAEWYQTAYQAFRRAVPGTDRLEAPILTRGGLQNFIVCLRERGVEPISCNSGLRAMNAFRTWVHQQGLIAQPVRVRPLKVEKQLARRTMR